MNSFSQMLRYSEQVSWDVLGRLPKAVPQFDFILNRLEQIEKLWANTFQKEIGATSAKCVEIIFCSKHGKCILQENNNQVKDRGWLGKAPKKKRFFLGKSPKQRTPPTHPYGLGLRKSKKFHEIS